MIEEHFSGQADVARPAHTNDGSLAYLPDAKIEPEQIYTQPETAALLRVSERALEAWRHRGGGPRFVRLGGGRRGAIRYRGKALLDYLAAAERTNTRDEAPA